MELKILKTFKRRVKMNVKKKKKMRRRRMMMKAMPIQKKKKRKIKSQLKSYLLRC